MHPLGAAAKRESMNIQEIKERLLEAFPGAQVDVTDLTGTEDHWDVYVKDEGFKNMSRIERHQAVMAAFQNELTSGEVHALSIRTEI